MKALRDFPMWLFNGVPERDPRYAHRSLAVILPVAAIAAGVFVWLPVTVSIWLALTLGIVVMGVAFFRDTPCGESNPAEETASR